MPRLQTISASEARAAAGVDPGFQKPFLPPTAYVAAGLWLAILVGLGLYLSCLQGEGVPEGLSPGERTFTLEQDAKRTEFGWHAVATVRDDAGKSRRVQVSFDDCERLLARDKVVSYALFSEFEPDREMRYLQQGVCARARLTRPDRCERTGLTGTMLSVRAWCMDRIEARDGKGSALLAAVLLGDRLRLEEGGLYDDMKAVGMAHMVAVSGAHLSVVSAFVMMVLKRIGMPKRAVVCVIMGFFAAYALFTGMSIPVLRAALMSSVLIGAVWGGRRGSPLAALSVCVCLLLAANPYNAFSLSFLLSVGSTLGIILFTGLFETWLGKALGGRFPTVCNTVALTMAANLVIFPVVASVFARLPLLSPVANLIAAPVFSVLLIGGLAALALCAAAPPLGSLALAVCAGAADLFCSIMHALAQVPYASLFSSWSAGASTAVSVALMALIWRVWPNPRAKTVRRALCAAAAALLVFLLVAPHMAGDEIVMLDVGQGDAFLIRSQGRTLLVDTGNQETMLSQALARHGANRLDALLVSHHDDDHYGSLPVLKSALAGGKVYVARETFTTEDRNNDLLLEAAERTVGADDVRGLSFGDVLQVGRFTCTVVWPHAFCDKGGNADSLCLRVEYDGDGDGSCDFTALFTGDAEADQISAMVEEGTVGDIDVLKEGHHGSRAGMTPELASALRPEVVLISVGADNDYGHPAPETVETLETAGAQVFRTDENGDVSCRFRANTLEVRAMR